MAGGFVELDRLTAELRIVVVEAVSVEVLLQHLLAILDDQDPIDRPVLVGSGLIHQIDEQTDIETDLGQFCRRPPIPRASRFLIDERRTTA